MRYQPILCPECGEPAAGTYDWVPARAEFGEVDPVTGEAEWSGHTELYWDGQYSEPEDDPEHTLLECHNAHTWLAKDRENEPLWDVKQNCIAGAVEANTMNEEDFSNVYGGHHGISR